MLGGLLDVATAPLRLDEVSLGMGCLGFLGVWEFWNRFWILAVWVDGVIFFFGRDLFREGQWWVCPFTFHTHRLGLVSLWIGGFGGVAFLCARGGGGSIGIGVLPFLFFFDIWIYTCTAVF